MVIILVDTDTFKEEEGGGEDYQVRPPSVGIETAIPNLHRQAVQHHY